MLSPGGLRETRVGVRVSKAHFSRAFPFHWLKCGYCSG